MSLERTHTNRLWGMIFVALLVSGLLIAGCAGDQQNNERTDHNSSEQNDVQNNDGTNHAHNENNADAATANNDEVTNDDPSSVEYPLTITDGVGEEVVIEEEPETFVTLIPSITETAFALGLGDGVVGVSDFCNYPEEALERERLGGQTINAEKVLELHPDVAFLSPYHHASHADLLDQFRAAGIEVVIVNSDANSFEEVYESIQLMAEVTGTTDEAEAIIADMEHQKEEIQAAVAVVDEPKRVWVEVLNDLSTTGAGTFMHEMLETIHAENIAQDVEGWAQFTEEEVVMLEPEMIITTYGIYEEGDVVQRVLARDGWSEVPAIVNEQVVDVDNDAVVRPGPHMMDGLQLLAETIYPEHFE